MGKISQEEKDSATLIPLDRIYNPDEDAESAFNDFRESFSTGDDPGQVRAWELTIDERGNVGTTRMQTRLGSWPIDAYKFDELCQLIVDQYMTPEQQRMAVRLCGTKKDHTGFLFNKIVMLKRALKKETSRETSNDTASLMKMMQEMNERNMAMFQRMQAPPVEKQDAMAEIQKMLAFAQAMNAPMMGMLQSLLPALAGRPAPQGSSSDPFGNLGSLLDVAERLSDMKGGGSGAGSDDDGIVGIIKAITPLAIPALQALPAIAAMAPKAAPRIAAPVAPQPQAAPQAQPQAATQPKPMPSNLQPTDIPSGDTEVLAQLKPQIDSLVQMAEQNSDPVGSADLVFDQVFLNVPEDVFEKLANFVDNPQFVSYVCLMNAAAKNHVQWFEVFKVQVVKRLTQEDSEAGQAPSAPGVAQIN
jgi:hypothetical protein